MGVQPASLILKLCVGFYFLGLFMVSLDLVYMTCLVKQKALESDLLALVISTDVEDKI